MLRRSTKIQLLIFVVITLLGVAYVGAEYVGLGKYVTGDKGCQVHAEFPDSGGIFTNAEVTYRGVTVGKVGSLNLIPKGVEVNLDLDSCSSPKIPASVHATVADRSVVGEQYVNLVPPNVTGSTTEVVDANGPYLAAGTVLPMKNNTIPVPTQDLLSNLDDLVNSVDLTNLQTTVSELGKAVSNRGDDLGRLLDATNSLLATASRSDNLDATIQLIQDASPVLQTQLDSQDPLKSWTHSLNLLTQTLKSSDPDIRHLLDTAPTDLDTIKTFIQDNQTDLGVTLANLVTVGNLLVEHLPGLEQVLELYPALAAGGQTALQGNTGKLGLILQVTATPEDCGDPKKNAEGYNGPRRSPSDLSPTTSNTSVRCTAPATGANAKNIRGSAHVPGGDPISTGGGNYTYNRVDTDNVSQSSVAVGSTLSNATNLGDGSWLGLLTDGLH